MQLRVLICGREKASKGIKDRCVSTREKKAQVEVDVASEAEEEDEDDADEEYSKMHLVVTARPLFLLANGAYTWNGKEWQRGVLKLKHVLEQGEVKQLIAIVLLKNVSTLNSLWMWVIIPASPNSELTVDVDMGRHSVIPVYVRNMYLQRTWYNNGWS
ncbi:hypothetical protein Tco_0919986 [Tanacetum coccineum]